VNRFNLIKALKNQHNSKVMAVGDDWQSIFRFAGSDIALFTRFNDFLGYSEILRIQKTYRNSQELIDIAGKFVMKNPKQLKKKLSTEKHINNPIKLYTYNSKPEPALVNALDEIVEMNGPEAEVMILGRTNYDIELLNNELFKITRSSKGVIIKCTRHPGLKLSFLTVHRSKGLEADNVIVLNLENKLLGFPNKISDDPILSLVLTDKDEYDFAEERRLFYVAITRTKNATFLIAPDKNPSVFVEELIKTEDIMFKPATGEVSIMNNPRCPVCLTGYLVIRESNASQEKFLGCSNYPHCDKTLKNVELIDGYVKCTSCGGYMVKRKGQYGDFYGCTNYPLCSRTIKVDGR
jgi:DNA helicase-4